MRYYRRLIPVLTRDRTRPSSASGEHPSKLDNLARWLTDGTRMIGSLSRSAAEQRQLELRLEAIEQAHHQLRDEVASRDMARSRSERPHVQPPTCSPAGESAGVAV